MKKCIKWALRLAIPILGAAVFTFVIQCTVGFDNFKIQETISNTWLTHLYGTQLNLRDIIEEPFRVLLLETSKFDSPFWCQNSQSTESCGCVRCTFTHCCVFYRESICNGCSFCSLFAFSAHSSTDKIFL